MSTLRAIIIDAALIAAAILFVFRCVSVPALGWELSSRVPPILMFRNGLS